MHKRGVCVFVRVLLLPLENIFLFGSHVSEKRRNERVPGVGPTTFPVRATSPEVTFDFWTPLPQTGKCSLFLSNSQRLRPQSSGKRHPTKVILTTAGLIRDYGRCFPTSNPL